MLCPPTLGMGTQRSGCLLLPTAPPCSQPPPPSPCPHRPARLTMMQLGLLMDHRLTRQSSPPVASSRPEPLPSTSEDTLLAWATISSTQERAQGGGQSGAERATWGKGGLGPAWPPSLAPGTPLEGSAPAAPLGPRRPS